MREWKWEGRNEKTTDTHPLHLGGRSDLEGIWTWMDKGTYYVLHRVYVFEHRHGNCSCVDLPYRPRRLISFPRVTLTT